MRRVSLPAWLLALLLLALPPLAAAGPRAAELVFVPETGEILASQEADHLWHPASLTKLMTAYLVFQELAAGRMTLDQELTVSQAAAAQPPTALGLAAGRKITVETALNAMLLISGNDAAVVLAEAVADSEGAFAARMTETARQLGMESSVFRNASGLPDDDQVTTARDLAILTRALLLEFPQYYDFFSRRGFDFAGDWRGNINGPLNAVAGADGLKTGFTCKSGYNLVISALRDGKRVAAVILGERAPELRRARAVALIDEAFAALQEETRAELALLRPAPALAEPAPAVLAPNECGYGVASRLPGWGVTLGTFRSRGKALDLSEAAKARYSAFAEAGTAAVRTKGTNKYSAALVGLSQSEARRGCKAIQNAGGYCKVLPPRILNNPNAVWR